MRTISTFLMATGYEQVRSVVAYLASDVEASEKVMKIMDFMDDLDDVQEVHTNGNFADDFEIEE